MKLTITSASGNILSADRFERLTLMTEAGEITVLPGHEPIISAVRPGEIRVEYYVGNQHHADHFVSGGGVLHVSPRSCVLVADVVHDVKEIKDLDYIEAQKKEAEAFVKNYKAENGPTVDPKRLIEIEYELLKYTAMHRLGKHFHEEQGSRK